MNIIKLKDIIMPDKHSIAEVFNKYLKDNYAYWIQMRYIVPMSVMSHSDYVDCEQNEKKVSKFPHIDMYSTECCMVNFVEYYVDNEETDRANSISKYLINNEHVTDDDITISEIKLFRRWLALTILNLNKIMDDLDPSLKLNDAQTHILEYYANDMYNDVVRYLTTFGNKNPYMDPTYSCGCCSQETLLITTSPINVCDSLTIYKENIRNSMIEMFSDINFWLIWSDDFILLFKKYIDNIIKVGLKINNTTSPVIGLKDCTCDNVENNNNTNILNRLSNSLGYILNKEHNSHKNYIHDALYDWSSSLYEYMQW
jgi:hypothetical protein